MESVPNLVFVYCSKNFYLSVKFHSRRSKYSKNRGLLVVDVVCMSVAFVVVPFPFIFSFLLIDLIGRNYSSYSNRWA